MYNSNDAIILSSNKVSKARNHMVLLNKTVKIHNAVFPTGFCETCGGRSRHILICIFMTSLRQVCIQTSFGTSDFLLYELSHTVIQLNAQ